MRVPFKLFCLALVLPFTIYAQPVPLLQNFTGNAPHINYPLNRITNSAALTGFFLKLSELKKNKNSVVRIVHIGDSHIQADFLSGFLRRHLQDFFGNAGRGLVFPYQLAKSNPPQDISSRSATGWEFNRIAHPKILIAPGVSGYVIQTSSIAATIEMSLNNAGNDSSLYFKKMQFFIDSGNASSWVVHAENNPLACFLNNNDSSKTTVYREILLDSFATKFSLTALPTTTLKSFYGVSLENNEAGILYHTIGVNGARYDQYNMAPLFWKQVAALQGDLYIISLGTNEAQQAVFNEKDFRDQVSLMIMHIKNINPDAAILVTTAPDSFKGPRANVIVKQLNTALTNYCDEYKVPLWDLYKVANGYSSCYNWFSKGFMNRDRIHFTADGYRLQGQLLFNALAAAYNAAIANF